LNEWFKLFRRVLYKSCSGGRRIIEDLLNWQMVDSGWLMGEIAYSLWLIADGEYI